MVSGTVNLQFQGRFVSISLRPVLRSVAQSGHHIINFSIWGFSIYKRAHRIWLKILPIVLEKELKILDYA